MEQRLTDEQMVVVNAIVGDQDPGVFVVNSAPGSGKTTVAIAAIKAHIAARPDDRVLMLTYNKNTDDSIRKRFGGTPLLSRPLSGGPSNTCVCTVNAAGYSLLSTKEIQSVSFDDAAWEAGLQCDDGSTVACAALEAMGMGRATVHHSTASVAKSATDTIAAIEMMFTHPPQRQSLLRGGVRTCEELKPKHLPFAAQTYVPVKLGIRCPVAFDLVVVDEFQDLQPIDAQLCLLFSPRRLVLVGDRHQSIYQWRGARCDEVLRIACAAFDRRVDMHLTQSFRCPQVVADVASRLVGSTVVGRDDPNGYVRRCSVDEWVTLLRTCQGSKCLMARTWSKLRRVAAALSAEGIPVLFDGIKFFRGQQLVMASTASDMVSLLRCPRRVGFFKKKSTCDDENTDVGRRAVWFELLTAAARNYGRWVEKSYNRDDAVALTTVHQMKGREVDHAAFWYEDDRKADDETEELNVMYTAITRARIGFCFVE